MKHVLYSDIEFSLKEKWIFFSGENNGCPLLDFELFSFLKDSSARNEGPVNHPNFQTGHAPQKIRSPWRQREVPKQQPESLKLAKEWSETSQLHN